MTDRLDYSVLDDPLWLQFVFHPRADRSTPPPGAQDHEVRVDEGTFVVCRMYPVDEGAPSILFFHGNGEVVSDYDWIAPLFNRIGTNLFVADYRGYGMSGGRPTFANTAADAHLIFEYFLRMLDDERYNGPVFVMGRSLGSQSALELAAVHQNRMQGLIIESGFGQHTRLMQYLGLTVAGAGIEGFDRLCLERLGRITLPVLLIHAEIDTIIPHAEALNLLEALGSEDKSLLTIPGAGHNDIMLVGMDRYFRAIREFVFG